MRTEGERHSYRGQVLEEALIFSSPTRVQGGLPRGAELRAALRAWDQDTTVTRALASDAVGRQWDETGRQGCTLLRCLRLACRGPCQSHWLSVNLFL